MEDIIDNSLCPVCFEVPAAEILQCTKGHWVCHQCYRKLKSCPVCRTAYGTEKIRTRALEDILDTRKSPCQKKAFGCELKSGRRDLTNHLSQCGFRTMEIKICESFGFECNFIANPQNIEGILQHFCMCHFALQNSVSNVCICLEGFGEAEVNQSASWTPVFLELKESQFMVLAKVNGNDQTVSIVCLLLSANTLDAKIFNAKIRITIPDSEVCPVDITTPVYSLVDCEKAVKSPWVRLSFSQLRKAFQELSALEVLVSVSENSVKPSVLDDINNWKRIYGVQEASPDNETYVRQGSTATSSPTYSGFWCHGCDKTPLKTKFYPCLQCDDYDLCINCRGQGVHAFHLFVEVSSAEEFAALVRINGANA